MPSAEALGTVRLVIDCWGYVGTSSLWQWLKALSDVGMWSGVYVAVADEGIGIRQHFAPPFPDIRLRWADIQAVEAHPDVWLLDTRLTFTVPGGRGFTLIKSLGQNNLLPLLDALGSHGIVVARRRTRAAVV